MQPAKFVVTAVSASVVSFLLGGLTYGWLLSDFFASNAGAPGVVKDPPEMWAIYCGELAIATLLTLVLGGWAKVTDAGTGAKGGLVIGLLVTTAFSLTIYGTSHMMNLTATVVDIALNAARLAIVGAVIGWLSGRGR
jgi:hypothetical protein